MNRVNELSVQAQHFLKKKAHSGEYPNDGHSSDASPQNFPQSANAYRSKAGASKDESKAQSISIKTKPLPSLLVGDVQKNLLSNKQRESSMFKQKFSSELLEDEFGEFFLVQIRICLIAVSLLFLVDEIIFFGTTSMDLYELGLPIFFAAASLASVVLAKTLKKIYHLKWLGYFLNVLAAAHYAFISIEENTDENPGYLRVFLNGIALTLSFSGQGESPIQDFIMTTTSLAVVHLMLGVDGESALIGLLTMLAIQYMKYACYSHYRMKFLQIRLTALVQELALNASYMDSIMFSFNPLAENETIKFELQLFDQHLNPKIIATTSELIDFLNSISVSNLVDPTTKLAMVNDSYVGKSLHAALKGVLPNEFQAVVMIEHKEYKAIVRQISRGSTSIFVLLLNLMNPKSYEAPSEKGQVLQNRILLVHMQNQQKRIEEAYSSVFAIGKLKSQRVLKRTFESIENQTSVVTKMLKLPKSSHKQANDIDISTESNNKNNNSRDNDVNTFESVESVISSVGELYEREVMWICENSSPLNSIQHFNISPEFKGNLRKCLIGLFENSYWLMQQENVGSSLRFLLDEEKQLRVLLTINENKQYYFSDVMDPRYQQQNHSYLKAKAMPFRYFNGVNSSMIQAIEFLELQEFIDHSRVPTTYEQDEGSLVVVVEMVLPVESSICGSSRDGTEKESRFEEKDPNVRDTLFFSQYDHARIKRFALHPKRDIVFPKKSIKQENFDVTSPNNMFGLATSFGGVMAATVGSSGSPVNDLKRKLYAQRSTSILKPSSLFDGSQNFSSSNSLVQAPYIKKATPSFIGSSDSIKISSINAFNMNTNTSNQNSISNFVMNNGSNQFRSRFSRFKSPSFQSQIISFKDQSQIFLKSNEQNSSQNESMLSDCSHSQLDALEKSSVIMPVFHNESIYRASRIIRR